MKKIIIVVGVIIISIFLVSDFHLGQKDYAIEYAKVFGSYDILLVDKYLDNDTVVRYRNNTKKYEELRHNVVNAFNEKKFFMKEPYSYGDTNMKNNISITEITSFVILEDKGSVENHITIEREKIYFNNWRTKTIYSDDEFFGYLFFGFPT